MARRLVLMRHGEAALAPGQSEGDLFSLGDLSLSARGRAEAEAARDLLAGFRFDAAFASASRRARETAEIVAAPHGLDVHVVPDLREFGFSAPGASYADVLARIGSVARALRDDADPLLPGGTRYSVERARFARAVDDALARHDRPLVVAHGLTNRAWLGGLLEMPPHALLRLAQDHACANVVDFAADGRATLVALNWRHER